MSSGSGWTSDGISTCAPRVSAIRQYSKPFADSAASLTGLGNHNVGALINGTIAAAAYWLETGPEERAAKRMVSDA